MSFFENLKLKYKVMIMVVLPLIVMCGVAITISNTLVKDKLLDDTKQTLGATAKSVLAAYDQNTGDYFQNDLGDVWKGAYNISKSQNFIDNLASKANVEVTFFYGDKRIVTSMKDDKGERLVGSPAGQMVVDNVLKDGNELFTNRVQVMDTMYFGYYVPVFQNSSDEIVGMIFVGEPVEKVNKSLNLITRVFVIVMIILMIISLLTCVILASSIASKIQRSMLVVNKISKGDLGVTIDKKQLLRKDEVGDLSKSTKDLVDFLGNMIGAISDNTTNLNASSQEMNAMASQADMAMVNIKENLDGIMDGALSQEGNAQNIKNNIVSINEMISTTLSEVDILIESANDMKNAGENVKKSFDELQSSNTLVYQTVQDIQKQTQETDESVDKIIQAVTLIADIAEQTNLLSLNASIEAARAGEAGKGFAVVAGEISNLATQSNLASVEISQMVDVLVNNSKDTIESMNKVQNAINKQNKKVDETVLIFDNVEKQIVNVEQGVRVIRESTNKLGNESSSISLDIDKLNDISKSNKDVVSSTLDDENKVSELVSVVNNMSGEINQAATDMAQIISKFTM